MPPGVDVLGPDRAQAGPRATRHAQAWGTAPSIHQTEDRGVEAVPAMAEGGSRPFWFGRARLYCPPHGGPIRIGLPVGHPARPDAPVAPVGLTTIDRVPLPVRGWPPNAKGHPRAPSRAALSEPTAARCVAHV